MNHIHGHEVIQFIRLAGENVSKEQLIELVTKHFGEDTSYYSCSDDGMDADGIVTFFETRGKLSFSNDCVSHQNSSGCSH